MQCWWWVLSRSSLVSFPQAGQTLTALGNQTINHEAVCRPLVPAEITAKKPHTFAITKKKKQSQTVTQSLKCCWIWIYFYRHLLSQPGQLFSAYRVIVTDDRLSVERSGNLQSIFIWWRRTKNKTYAWFTLVHLGCVFIVLIWHKN